MNIGNSDERISTDVLVLGGGLGGCFAAIKAAEEGARVVILEKAEIRRSGSNATGIGSMILVHPDYNVSYREFAKLNVEAAGGIADEDICYEFAKDTLDRLLDLESYGLRIRSDDGSFYFVPAVDVCKGHNVRIWAPGPTDWHDLKPVLAKKVMSFPNITVLNRTAVIGLLTEDGVVGNRVIGAIGLETRTGRFVICEAKAVIVTSGDTNRLQRYPDTLYAPTRFVACGPPTNCGEGLVMAYKAGADIINMEFGCSSVVWKDFVHDGAPRAATMGRQITGTGGVYERKSSPDRFGLYLRTYQGASNTEGPFYYDVSNVDGWPEKKGAMERFVWTLEGEGTNAGYLLWLKERGEDFAKGPVEVEWRQMIGIHNNQPGVHIDVSGRSSLEGLYCAGDAAAGGWRHSSQGAFVFGARAGKNAAEYCKRSGMVKINKEQVKSEKKGLLEPLAMNPRDGYSWIELEDKARRIATDYGPPLTNDAKLERGLTHLERIKARYLPELYARNPREMMRASEVKAVFVVVEAFLRAALFRKESRKLACTILHKTEYPERDDKNWLKHTLIRNLEGQMTLSTREVKRLEAK